MKYEEGGYELLGEEVEEGGGGEGFYVGTVSVEGEGKGGGGETGGGQVGAEGFGDWELWERSEG